MKTAFVLVTAMLCGGVAAGDAAAESRYSKALQNACANDYRRLCGEYGIETEALSVHGPQRQVSRQDVRRCPGRRRPGVARRGPAPQEKRPLVALPGARTLPSRSTSRRFVTFR
jgi:hypothetical protein